MQHIVDEIIRYAEDYGMTIRDVVREAETKAMIRLCLVRTSEHLSGKIFMISTPHTPSNRDVFMGMYDDVEDGWVMPVPVTKASAIGMAEYNIEDWGRELKISLREEEDMVCVDDESMTGARAYSDVVGEPIICELKMICSDKEEYFERMARGRENSFYVQNKVPQHITKKSQQFSKRPVNNPVAGRN